ncbi:GlnS Glutamyl- and glutaminyl-tRNA synthetases [Rhabdaerophilaceae bacterium]
MGNVYRFAPSPTGYLHIGNARTALWNALLARQTGGIFLLRFDDTDVERSKPEFADGILEDLAWLGIQPDRIERQSARFGRYAEVLADFQARGLVYACYETPEELDRKRKRQQARGLPPVYDRAALALSEADRARFEADGRTPYWRFKLSGKTVRWLDGVRGECHIETASLSDPILARAGGQVLYTLASVIDDADFAITDVLRGEDHVANTAVQIELFEAKGARLPRFSHHNLIASATGEEMSKRTGALSLRSFRTAGIDPLAVATVAALTGTSEAVRPLASLDELAGLLDPAHFSRALTKFDPAEINDLSVRLLHAKPFDQVAPLLAPYGIAGVKAEAFWQAIHGNVSRIEEAATWWTILMVPQHFEASEPEFLAQAATMLPAEPFDADTWGQWISAIQAKTARKGKALFMPLRLALTGRESGPELKAVLPLLGRPEVLARLAPVRPHAPDA